MSKRNPGKKVSGKKNPWKSLWEKRSPEKRSLEKNPHGKNGPRKKLSPKNLRTNFIGIISLHKLVMLFIAS